MGQIGGVPNNFKEIAIAIQHEFDCCRGTHHSFFLSGRLLHEGVNPFLHFGIRYVRDFFLSQCYSQRFHNCGFSTSAPSDKRCLMRIENHVARPIFDSPTMLHIGYDQLLQNEVRLLIGIIVLILYRPVRGLKCQTHRSNRWRTHLNPRRKPTNLFGQMCITPSNFGQGIYSLLEIRWGCIKCVKVSKFSGKDAIWPLEQTAVVRKTGIIMQVSFGRVYMCENGYGVEIVNMTDSFRNAGKCCGGLFIPVVATNATSTQKPGYRIATDIGIEHRKHMNSLLSTGYRNFDSRKNHQIPIPARAIRYCLQCPVSLSKTINPFA